MLVLSRKPGEFIEYIIPPSTTETRIRVKTVGLGRNVARLGSEAPEDVKIVRGELLTDDTPPAE